MVQWPTTLKNRLAEYPTPKQLQEKYDHELQTLIDNGWLFPCPEDELGPLKGLILLMAVQQENKQKVRSVMDYHELNEHMNTYTALLNLQWAYLQIHVDESLWPFQTVKIKRYCLTHLGFGLNMASQIMWPIVKAMVRQDEVSTVPPFHTLMIYSSTRVYVPQPTWRCNLSDLDCPARTLNYWEITFMC